MRPGFPSFSARAPGPGPDHVSLGRRWPPPHLGGLVFVPHSRKKNHDVLDGGILWGLVPVGVMQRSPRDPGDETTRHLGMLWRCLGCEGCGILELFGRVLIEIEYCSERYGCDGLGPLVGACSSRRVAAHVDCRVCSVSGHASGTTHVSLLRGGVAMGTEQLLFQVEWL